MNKIKILHVTPEEPSLFSGGGMGILQTRKALLNNRYEVDYLGPEITNSNFKDYHKLYFFKSGPLILRIFDAVFFNFSKWYRSWKKIEIDYSIYDVIIMDFTKLHYIVRKIDKSKLLIRVHNVEFDYAKNVFIHAKSLKNLYILIATWFHEYQLVRQAPRLLTLSVRDKKRLVQLYKINADKINLMPVCLSMHNQINTASACIQDRPLSMLITGSLWYESNIEGIIWFVTNILPKIEVPNKLIVAGRRPPETLKTLLNRMSSVTLISDPESMDELFLNADIAVAPIFSGAGMKVKVAEAMSYGLPVLGTPEAFEGYQTEKCSGLYLCLDENDFLNTINSFYYLTQTQRSSIRKALLANFEKHYSLEACQRIMSNEIAMIMQGEIV